MRTNEERMVPAMSDWICGFILGYFCGMGAITLCVLVNAYRDTNKAATEDEFER